MAPWGCCPIRLYNQNYVSPASMRNTDVEQPASTARSVYDANRQKFRMRGGKRTPREESIFREDGDGVDEKDCDWGGQCIRSIL